MDGMMNIRETLFTPICLYLKNTKWQPTTGDLSLEKQIQYTHGKAGTQLILIHQPNGTTIYTTKTLNPFQIRKLNL